ncbi:MAG: 50S ribosomal protein L11 methyltransferase, partial [Methylococcales bacterium]
NILANVLEELAPILTEYVKPGGKLVLAGIFSEQVEQVLNAYPNFRFAPPVPSDNWVRLDGMCHSKIRIPVPDPTTLKHVYPVPSM